ncbi:hypothetical protein [Nocardia sp. R7R-8]|uniref:hypothetical protein n=1 Tax=Nocardia sp. R7R-8 TaxID=3459304 RepID=UPI00403D9A03
MRRADSHEIAVGQRARPAPAGIDRTGDRHDTRLPVRHERDSYVQMLIMGSLKWAVEWWTPRKGALESVIRTAQSLIRNGISGSDSIKDRESTQRRPRTQRKTATPG